MHARGPRRSDRDEAEEAARKVRLHPPSAHADIFDMQRSIGNRAVSNMLARSRRDADGEPLTPEDGEKLAWLRRILEQGPSQAPCPDCGMAYAHHDLDLSTRTFDCPELDPGLASEAGDSGELTREELTELVESVERNPDFRCSACDLPYREHTVDLANMWYACPTVEFEVPPQREDPTPEERRRLIELIEAEPEHFRCSRCRRLFSEHTPALESRWYVCPADSSDQSG